MNDSVTLSIMSSGRGGHRKGAGRKSPWKNGETQTIRVPKVFATQLLEIARRLDEGETIEFETKSKKKRESVTKSKPKRVDYVTESVNPNLIMRETLGTIQPLPARALARRLGVSDTAVRNHRDGLVPPEIPEWTQGRDPEGIAWEYREETKLFHPKR